MDILQFINSRDIRAYLRKTGYVFGAVEAAYVVYQSQTATLEEKLAAWQEIADSEKEPIVLKPRKYKANDEPYPIDLQSFLKTYIQTVRQIVDAFCTASGAVYTFRYKEKDTALHKTNWISDCKSYADFASCQKAAKKTTKLVKYTFHKIYKEESEEKHALLRDMAFLYQNEKQQFLLPPRSLKSFFSVLHTEVFQDMWLDIPTPFRCGDIVREIDPFCDTSAHVLYYLEPWDRNTLLEKGFPANNSWLNHADESVKRCQKTGDESDMRANGCHFDENGNLEMDSGSRGFSNYLNLEYVNEKLSGSERLLYVLSGFFRGKLDIDDFLNFTDFIRLEKRYRDAEEIVLSYHDQFLNKVGLDGAEYLTNARRDKMHEYGAFYAYLTRRTKEQSLALKEKLETFVFAFRIPTAGETDAHLINVHDVIRFLKSQGIDLPCQAFRLQFDLENPVCKVRLNPEICAQIPIKRGLGKDSILYEEADNKIHEKIAAGKPVKIWLDDTRIGYHCYNVRYIHCYSVNEVKQTILECEKQNVPIEVIDCDHDLGSFTADGGDGIKLIDWLAERESYYPIKLHTINPIGHENMQHEIERYWK